MPMEKVEKENFETLKSSGGPTPFPPNRRSHLKSETLRTLVRILSLCYDESQRSHVIGIVQDQPEKGNGSKGSGQETELGHAELVGFDGTESGNSLIQKDTVVDENIEAVGLQDTELGQALLALEDESELIVRVKGNEELGRGDSAHPSTLSSEENRNGDFAPLINNQEDPVDFQQILMVEDGNVGQLQVDNEHQNCKFAEAFNLSLDKDMITELSKPGEIKQDTSSSLKKNATEEAEDDMQQKYMEVENSVCIDTTRDSCHRLTADGEIEEGEISEDYDQSVDLFPEDALALEEKIGEEQSSKDCMNKEDFTANEQKRANEKDNESTHYFNTVDNADNNRNNTEYNCKMVVHEEHVMTKMIEGVAGRYRRQGGAVKGGLDSSAASPDDLLSHHEISKENATDNQGITSGEKVACVCKEKKQGVLTKEHKEKRKRKNRKKRAEKNRQLGVKRLKLQPVLKPKTVTYCRHYLKGRCQKGDECMFSHDTPCCHFARQACMKGDDCPFDHQLSKYPCNNYASKGSCSRGDKCMFSHKIPLQEGFPTAPSVSEPNVKSLSPLGNSNSKKQLNTIGTSHQNVNVLSYSGGIFFGKNTAQNVAESVLKLPAQAPKGISFLSFGKLPLDNSCKLKQAGLSLSRDDGVTVGNQTNQSASDMFQNFNEVPKITSCAMAPKGINSLIQQSSIK